MKRRVVDKKVIFRTLVEEALDQDTSQMQAKVEITEFTDLPNFIDQPVRTCPLTLLE